MTNDRIIINLPPMPNPKDFDIDWENHHTNKFDQQLKAYEEALAAWKEVGAALMKNVGD